MMYYEKNWLWIQLLISLNLMTMNQCQYFIWHIIHLNSSFEMIQKLLTMNWVITSQKYEKSVLFIIIYYQESHFLWKMTAWLMIAFCLHNFSIFTWNFFSLNNDNMMCEKNRYQRIWSVIFMMISLSETWSDFRS